MQKESKTNIHKTFKHSTRVSSLSPILVATNLDWSAGWFPEPSHADVASGMLQCQPSWRHSLATLPGRHSASIHSPTHSLVPALSPPLIHSLIHSLIHLFGHLFFRLYAPSCIRSLIHSLNHSFFLSSFISAHCWHHCACCDRVQDAHLAAKASLANTNLSTAMHHGHNITVTRALQAVSFLWLHATDCNSKIGI